MKNFRKETAFFFEVNGLSLEDVVYVGSKDGRYECTWDEFVELSDFDYLDEYNCLNNPGVVSDLTIHFKDGATMSRFTGFNEGWYLGERIEAAPTPHRITNLIPSTKSVGFDINGANGEHSRLLTVSNSVENSRLYGEAQDKAFKERMEVMRER